MAKKSNLCPFCGAKILSEAEKLKAEELIAVVDVWNKTEGVTPIRKLTDARKTVLARRLREDWPWREALVKFPLKLFEAEPTGWQPDFDWFIRPDTANMVLEGKYDWVKDGQAEEVQPEPKTKRDRLFVDGEEVFNCLDCRDSGMTMVYTQEAIERAHAGFPNSNSILLYEIVSLTCDCAAGVFRHDKLGTKDVQIDRRYDVVSCREDSLDLLKAFVLKE